MKARGIALLAGLGLGVLLTCAVGARLPDGRLADGRFQVCRLQAEGNDVGQFVVLDTQTGDFKHYQFTGNEYVVNTVSRDTDVRESQRLSRQRK